MTFQRRLWLGIALTLPLLGVEMFRVVNGLPGSDALSVHVPLPVILLAVIILTTVLAPRPTARATQRNASQRRLDPVLVILLYGLLLWHAGSALMARDAVLAIRELVKLTIGLGALCAVHRYFPRDRVFAKRFWTVALWSTIGITALLVFRHAFVFDSPYMGANVSTATRVGRNALMFFLSLVIPVALTRAWMAERRAVAGVGLAILLVGWIYAGSRGAWLSVALAFAVIIVLTQQGQGARKVAKIPGMILVAALAVLGTWAVLTHYVDTPDAAARFSYIFDPSSAPDLNSYEARLGRAEGSWELFLGSPVMGVGMTNDASVAHEAGVTGGDVSHNDYVSILSELGILGFLLFVGFLWRVGSRGWRIPRTAPQDLRWISVGVRGSFVALLVYLNFANTYRSPWMWLFLGLFLVVKDFERTTEAARIPDDRHHLAPGVPHPAGHQGRE